LAQDAAPEGSRLRLRSATQASGPEVRLLDVLDFSAADPRLAEQIGDKPAPGEEAGDRSLRISHAAIVAALDELGVNMARVLVSGALVCEVTPAEYPSAEAPGAVSNDPGPLFREDAPAADGALRGLLEAHIRAELAKLGGRVEVDFDRASAEFLELTSPPFEFSIRGAGASAALGLREYQVGIRRDGRAQRSVRISARTRIVQRVLVAQKPINRGAFIRRDMLDYDDRIFATGEPTGLERVEELIGQQASRFIPAGEMVARKDIKSVDLVTRSRPVTVVGGDNVSLRITGVALDAGGLGETVRVRLGDGRRNHREVRGVVTAVGTVRLEEEGA